MSVYKGLLRSRVFGTFAHTAMLDRVDYNGRAMNQPFKLNIIFGHFLPPLKTEVTCPEGKEKRNRWRMQGVGAATSSSVPLQVYTSVLYFFHQYIGKWSANLIMRKFIRPNMKNQKFLEKMIWNTVKDLVFVSWYWPLSCQHTQPALSVFYYT